MLRRCSSCSARSVFEIVNLKGGINCTLSVAFPHASWGAGATDCHVAVAFLAAAGTSSGVSNVV